MAVSTTNELHDSHVENVQMCSPRPDPALVGIDIFTSGRQGLSIELDHAINHFNMQLCQGAGEGERVTLVFPRS